jgi:hypothetical protein
MRNDFAVFILTHGRPDKVITYSTIRDSGYTGKIYLIVDDEDKTKDEYLRVYKNEVIVFSKKEIAKTFDSADNFDDRRAIIYARNASFQIAKDLQLKYFLQLDDDYRRFSFRFDERLRFIVNPDSVKSLDRVFSSVLKFYESIPCSSIAFAQGGDFLGGKEGQYSKAPWLKRKCMNSFFCSTERPFQFIGRINEDVNTYTHLGSKGLLFFTASQVYLNQLQTQSNSGGMTEFYLSSGTYVKSFYTVMHQPSSVKIALMKSKHPRFHHQISWNKTVPKIIRENYGR